MIKRKGFSLKLKNLRLIIEDYFSAYNSPERCKSLLPHKEIKHWHSYNNAYHPNSGGKMEYYIKYGISEEDFNSALNDLFKYFEDYCKALFICLNVKYEKILPDLKKDRVVNNNIDAGETAVGTGIGALVGAIFGIPLVGAGIGALFSAHNSAHKDNLLEASARTLYENAEKLRIACTDYFSDLIDKKMQEGMTDTVKEPEYALYDVKLVCPMCGKKLRKVKGKYGWFMSCYGYPSCDYTAKYIPAPRISRPTKYCDGEDFCNKKKTDDLDDLFDDDLPF